MLPDRAIVRKCYSPSARGSVSEFPMCDSACIFQIFFRQQGMCAPPVFIFKMKEPWKRNTAMKLEPQIVAFWYSPQVLPELHVSTGESRFEIHSTSHHPIIKGPKPDLAFVCSSPLTNCFSLQYLVPLSGSLPLLLHGELAHVGIHPCRADTACSSSAGVSLPAAPTTGQLLFVWK